MKIALSPPPLSINYFNNSLTSCLTTIYYLLSQAKGPKTDIITWEVYYYLKKQLGTNDVDNLVFV